MTFRLTREQLYELVWSEALSRLRNTIGISDVAIAKHCRKADIPIPERGYWNKLQAGKPVRRVPLSPRDLATADTIEMGGTLTPELKARITGEPGVEADPEDIDVLTERFRKRLGKVNAPRDLSRADPAIAKLLKRDETIRQKMAEGQFYWEKPRFESPYERRRLRILNAIFLAFARVGGGSGYFRDNEAREVSIHGPAAVSITLDTQKRRNHRGRGQLEAADAKETLVLSAEVGRHHPGVVASWSDDESGKLEDRLTEIVVGLAVVSEHESRRWKAEMAEWRRKQEAEEAEARRKAKEKAERMERERIAAEQQAKLDGLLAEATAWKNAALIREYVEAKIAQAEESTPELEAWVQFALTEANRIDPIAGLSATVAVPARAVSDQQAGPECP
jgi:hypothetical protein